MSGDVASPSGDRPRLAVVYHPELARPLALNAAARGGWDVLWLVDFALAQPDSVRLLRRFGDPIDVTGLTPDAAADVIAPAAPSGILTFADVQLLWTAGVAARLGLPFFSPSAADRLVNKGAQRRALLAAGIPTPRFWPLPTATDLPARGRIVAEVEAAGCFPVVVKPQESAASRNTYRACDGEQLLRAVIDAADECSGLIIEEMLRDGWPRGDRPYADYVSVESVLTASGICHLMVTGKFPLAEPFRESGDFVPSNLPAEMQEDAKRLAGEAIAALADGPGVFHTEIKFTVDGPRVIEVNGRIGGMIGEIIDAATGNETLQIVADVALGKPVACDRPMSCSRIAYSADVQAPSDATRLLDVENLDEVRQLDGVDSVVMHVAPGQALNWRVGTLGHVYSVTGTAASFDDLWRVHRQLRELVVMKYEKAPLTVERARS
jgi:biotin carboxylase